VNRAASDSGCADPVWVATVRRYATAATTGRLTGGARLARPALLGPHVPYLRQRWEEGIRSTGQLHRNCATAAAGTWKRGQRLVLSPGPL
jgi:hypothetical protein